MDEEVYILLTMYPVDGDPEGYHIKIDTNCPEDIVLKVLNDAVNFLVEE